MTVLGGATNDGVIFEYVYSTNSCTKKIDLNSGASGSRPVGSLVQAPNGKLYGMTGIGNYGGDPGWIFEYNYSTNIYTKKFHLNNTDGRAASGSLMLASNGKLYGLTSEGGVNNEGVIFEYDYTTNTYTKKFDLGGNNGQSPEGSLMQASNGKLYGMTPSGGANNKGVIFEYDYSTNTFVKKLDFNGINGSEPSGTLIEIDVAIGIDNTKNKIQFTVFPNPSNNIFTISFSSTTKDKLFLKITNEVGKIIYTEKQKDFSIEHVSTIDLSQQPKGIYFLEIVSNGERAMKKIVLE
jgi:uncharacterized repeat protein (TIGR03803 family)